MKLFVISRNDIDYEEVTDVLVRAESEYAARELAATKGPRANSWIPENATCLEIKLDGPAAILMEQTLNG